MSMNTKERYLKSFIKNDLEKKMVFLGGPRQVGKTTLSQSISNKFSYLNWDEAEHREMILNNKMPVEKLIIFDELHKYRNWRNWLKGKFDTLKTEHQFLITGSARLDLYRYAGDSLQGRYFYYRLHPMTVSELGITTKKDFLHLLNLSGFPEPFLSGSERDHKRWSRDYRSRFLKEDLSPVEIISDIGSLELLALRLPELVGSPLSINNLRVDLQKSHKTISRWLDVLERLYGIYRISPFGSPKIKAVKKEQKHYHFDWSLPEEAEKKLENLIAGHLLKWVHFKQDTEGEDLELRYFRDSEGREVDFVVTQKNKPTLFVEVKTSAKEVSPHLVFLKKKFPDCPAFQVHLDEKTDYKNQIGIRVCPAWVFLKDYI